MKKKVSHKTTKGSSAIPLKTKFQPGQTRKELTRLTGFTRFKILLIL